MTTNEMITKHLAALQPMFDHISEVFEQSPATQTFLVDGLDDKAYDLNSRTIDKKHKRFITKMLERTYGYDVNEESHISTCVDGAGYTKETIYINIDLV